LRSKVAHDTIATNNKVLKSIISTTT